MSAQRGGHPADRHFTVRRIVGSGDLWVSECIITYDGVPTYSVSSMEFAHEKVVHEKQYFADTFRAPAWRKALAELSRASVMGLDRIGFGGQAGESARVSRPEDRIWDRHD